MRTEQPSERSPMLALREVDIFIETFSCRAQTTTRATEDYYFCCLRVQLFSEVKRPGVDSRHSAVSRAVPGVLRT